VVNALGISVCLGVALLPLVGGCAARHPADARQGALLPGSARLAAPALGASSSQRWRVTRRAAADTIERPFAAVTRADRPAGPRAVLTFVWEPPFDSRDSLVIARGSLAPVAERLAFRGVTREYHYDGPRVTGRMQRPDSSWDAYDHTFDEPVFAFNEVEILVRSLRYAPGVRLVAPLFSEVDRALEHDTLTVVGRAAPVGRDSTWVVRFADPAIVTLYTVDPARREIVDAVTTQRQSGGVLRYRREE